TSFGFHYIAAKLDTLGNCLWTLSANEKKPSFTFSLPQRQEVDYNGNPIFTGYFSDSLFLLDTVFFAGQNTNTFIYKIADFSITRGDVYPGPYCAGDTIDIPYTVKGKFNTGNEFIAQLSDEDGNFLGGKRELGRLKSNTDGVVKGILPLFSVFTSGNYRIRILSTSPPAQSYYRQDTLRLLIYSRDSANAGLDTTICYGQKIRLTTTGGSKWEWAPAATLDNPATYRPFASPKTDTEYRIIISDSSGCGDVDTDYVWVRVRQPLKIDPAFPDTTICRGQPVELSAATLGGDSLNYRVAWYERINGADVFIDSGTKFITTTCGDSCEGQPKNIIAVLTDNCTVEPDTGFYKISVLDALDISIINAHKKLLTDTLLCEQQSVTLHALGKGGRLPYTVKWYDSAGNIATGDSALLQPALRGIYTAVLTDNCTIKPDTARAIVSLRPPLSVTVDADDSICEGKLVTLRATGTGGDTTKYAFKWNNGAWSFDNTPAFHSPLTTGYYKITLSDNCSPAVTDSFKITVLPVPVADFDVSPTSGCPPLQVTFTDKSVNHDTTLTTWKISPAEALGVKTHTHPFYSGGNYHFGITVKNAFGCVHDTAKNVKIEVYNKPTASFFIKPDIKEIEEPLLLYNTSQNGNTYTWDFGNGTILGQNNRNDTSFSYTDSGTYEVKLIAENDKGCKDTTSQLIRVFDKIHCVIPNAFTPNNDGLNPVFAPVCAGIAQYTLTIYNRWGQVLHNCENCSWDGTYDGAPVIDGVYMYQIQLRGENRKKSTVFGMVNVIR
ncbi:MAG TPA: PKD domain-containing protein, partial [Bacteroidia bacterium]|nr:PKD domain-containing protein [Bacteroidia bacterium]